MSKKVSFLSALLCLLLKLSALASGNEYWISYTAPHGDTEGPTPGGAKYVLKIDSVGNVLIPSTKVLPNILGYVSPFSGATALSQEGRSLILWIPDNRQDPENPPFHPLFRAVFDKLTLRLTSIRKTKLLVHSTTAAQATDKRNNNFLAVVAPNTNGEVNYVGAPISVEARLEGRIFDITSSSLTCPCEAGISSKGRILLFLDKIGNKPGRVMLQRLKATGQSIGNPVEVVRGSVTPDDVSNVVSRNKRFVIYNRDHIHPKLYLQVIDNDSLQGIGPAVFLANQTGFGLQTAVMDPRGRFVVYAQGGPGKTSFVVFQALDSTGHPSGQPKVIGEKVQGGMDILEDK